MKKANPFWLILISVLLYSCNNQPKPKDVTFVKLEIIKAEKDFEKTVSQKGLAEGFYQFADSNATIKRENDTLIHGRDRIRAYYSNPKFNNVSLAWKPEFVDVAAAGDIAYTYGTYSWSSKDSIGNERVSKGIFHTVWKKQKDGSWKFVWD